jgi:4-coumarate--CoA ligase
VPPLILLFVHSKNLDKYDLSSVRTVMSGAAPLSPELCEAFIKRLPNSIIIQGYGTQFYLDVALADCQV